MPLHQAQKQERASTLEESPQIQQQVISSKAVRSQTTNPIECSTKVLPEQLKRDPSLAKRQQIPKQIVSTKGAYPQTPRSSSTDTQRLEPLDGKIGREENEHELRGALLAHSGNNFDDSVDAVSEGTAPQSIESIVEIDALECTSTCPSRRAAKIAEKRPKVHQRVEHENGNTNTEKNHVSPQKLPSRGVVRKRKSIASKPVKDASTKPVSSPCVLLMFLSNTNNTHTTCQVLQQQGEDLDSEER